MVNELYDAMQAGHGKDSLGRILDGLVQYTKFHFAREEKFFAQTAYPAAVPHKQEHDALTRQVLDVQQKVCRGGLCHAVTRCAAFPQGLADQAHPGQRSEIPAASQCQGDPLTVSRGKARGFAPEAHQGALPLGSPPRAGSLEPFSWSGWTGGGHVMRLPAMPAVAGIAGSRITWPPPVQPLQWMDCKGSAFAGGRGQSPLAGPGQSPDLPTG